MGRGGTGNRVPSRPVHPSVAGSAGPLWPARASRPPGVPVPTCWVLGPEPGSSSSGRSERSPAPHPPAAPPRPSLRRRRRPRLKKDKTEQKKDACKKTKKKRRRQMMKPGCCARGSAGRGSRGSSAGDSARGGRPRVPHTPGCSSRGRPAPGSPRGPAPPRGASTIGRSSCQSERRAWHSPRPRPRLALGAVLRAGEEVRGGRSVRTGPGGPRRGGAGVPRVSSPWVSAASGCPLGRSRHWGLWGARWS